MFRSGPGTVCLCVRSEMSLLTWRVRLCGDGVLVFIGMEWRCCLFMCIYARLRSEFSIYDVLLRARGKMILYLVLMW